MNSSVLKSKQHHNQKLSINEVYVSTCQVAKLLGEQLSVKIPRATQKKTPVVDAHLGEECDGAFKVPVFKVGILTYKTYKNATHCKFG